MDSVIHVMPLRIKPVGSPAAEALRAVANAIDAGVHGQPDQIELVTVVRGADGVSVTGSVGGEALGAYFLLGLGQRRLERPAQ